MPETILVGLPTRDGTLSKETEYSLTHNSDGLNLVRIMTSGLGVIDARNSIAAKMIQASNDPNSICAWIDSDSFWLPGVLSKLVGALALLPVRSTVSGYSGPRRQHGHSFGFKTDKGWETVQAGRDPELCPIVRCGLQFTVHRLGLLQALPANPFNWCNNPEWVYPSDDYRFFKHVQEVGGSSYMLTSAPVAHVDVHTGLAYLPHSGAFKVVNNELVPYVRPRYKNYAEFDAAKSKRPKLRVRTY